MYHRFARREGLTPIFFTIDHVHFKKRIVSGYQYIERKNIFRKVVVPIPTIIHNRVKPTQSKNQVEQLAKMSGINLFNLDNRLNKWTVYQVLSRFPELHRYLPKTHLLSDESWRKFNQRFSTVYIKPLGKSLGMDICRIDKQDGQWRMVHSTGKIDMYQKMELEAKLGKLMEKEEYLVQQAIALKRINHQAVDFRVAVQRGANGEWTVSGMVARLGPKHGIATNLAVGGKSKKMDEVLGELGINDPQQIKDKIREVVILAAQRLGSSLPGLADLGFDIAIDEDEQVWIIEVNGRDLRITFYQAKDFDSWHRTIQTPMQYAGYLVKRIIKRQRLYPKVTLVTPGNLPVDKPGSGSVEICSRQITNHLSRFVPVTLLGAHVHKHQITARQVSLSDNNRKQYQREVIQYLQNHPSQIIQIENRPLWIMNPQAQRLYGKKVLFLHSETYLKPPYLIPRERKRVLNKYDLILTNSQFLRKRVLAIDSNLAPRCHVIPLGVNIQLFPSIHDPQCHQSRVQARQKRKLSGKPVLLFVGRLIPQKGLHHLLEAFVEVVKQEPQVRLLIAGSSYYGKNIETEYLKTCKQIVKSCENQIEWLGYVPNDQLPEIYQLADVLVTPSVGSEAFGLVNLEAMSTGLPVLTTRVGGIGEVVQDGRNGKLLQPKNLSKRLEKVLLHWLKNPKNLKEMGKQSRQIVEELFSWERVANDLNNVYKTLMK